VERDSDFLKQSFLNNPPLDNGGGLFVPVVGCGSSKPNHMHHEIETLELETHDLHASHHHGLTALSSIYLEAGLPLDLAVEAAAADYALFEEELLCA
jgi:hypothetical protein